MSKRPVTSSPYDMVSPDEALAIVLEHAPEMPAIEVTLTEAGGSVLASDVLAQDPLPPFTAAVKDGYAVIAADGPGDYPVIGEIHAGWTPEFTLTPGTVAYITTGAPMPTGADAVIMVEDTETVSADNEPPVARMRIRVTAGNEVRSVGVDVETGQVVLNKGERLTAAEIGILATVGRQTVEVYRKPRVAVLSTGDELVDVGRNLLPGKIRDCNRPMLLEAITEAGATPLDLGAARDNPGEVAARLGRALAEADVILTSGGVSMGDADFIKPILERQGQIHFGRIRLKPGKPLTFATVEFDGQTRLVFGLPGNPVSSLVTYHLFVMPALRKMMGASDPMLHRIQVYLADTLKHDPERTEYHRVILRWDRALNNGAGGYMAHSTGIQVSSRLLSMRRASALVELRPGDEPIPAGAIVDALMIGPCQS